MGYRDELFDVWAPPTAAWSAWAKPVVFAHIDWPAAEAGVQFQLPPLPAIPRGDDGRTAVVVDLARDDQISKITRAMGGARVDDLIREAAEALRSALGSDRTAYHVGPTQFVSLAE